MSGPSQSQLIRVRCLKAQATMFHLASWNMSLTNADADLATQIAVRLDSKAEQELGASHGIIPRTIARELFPPGSPTSAPSSVTNMKLETQAPPISKDISNLKIREHLEAAKLFLASTACIWKGAPERLLKPLRIAKNQVERAIQNMELFDQVRVSGMISMPSNLTSSPEPSTSWNSRRSTSLPMPDTTDSFMATENFEEDTLLTPRTEGNVSDGSPEKLAPERPQKLSKYFAPHSPGMPYISDPPLLEPWHGSPGSLWNTAASSWMSSGPTSNLQ